MHLKAILNCIAKQPGFVFDRFELVDTDRNRPLLKVGLRERRGSKPICSVCGKKGRCYDRRDTREWDFVPLWMIAVVFVYAPRRVNCPDCGVRIEALPWARGKNRLTDAYVWFLARWARRLSWTDVAKIFGTNWGTVFRAVEYAVTWGRARMSMENIDALGVDEVQWRYGHKYMTVVYQISAGCRRLLWVGLEREEKTLEQFFHWFGAERAKRVRFVCTDMWQCYIKVLQARVPQAIHVLDRFHVVKRLGRGVDQTRAAEATEYRKRGEQPVLAKTRWCLLKRPENLTDKQRGRLAELVRLNLRTVRAYLMKEEFDALWSYVSPHWAGHFLDRWCDRAMRSNIEPMKKVARTMRDYRPMIINWFRARQEIAKGAVEGFNNKLKLVMRRSYGFRTFHIFEIAVYHALGNLPEPEDTHRFC